MSELHWMAANAAAAAIANGEMSPVELVKALLDRIARLDPGLNAFLHVDAEAALKEARATEAEAAQGQLRGALHGVPVGIKDIIDVAGLPTTCHSKIFENNVAATTDAECVARLRAAGAIILGKLSTHEFAIGGPSFDLPWPPARNPWNRDHHPGGSSSGSGCGLAAGLFPMALGTDTGGSVRNPASACAIVGTKPTYGLVSRRGVFPLAFTLDHVGPMTRTVADNALMLGILAGHDPLDPASVSLPESYDYMKTLEHGVRGLRIGFVRHFHEEDMPADPEVVAGLDRVALTLRSEGADVIDVRLPPGTAGLARGQSGVRFVQSEAWSIRFLGPVEIARLGDYGRLAETPSDVRRFHRRGRLRSGPAASCLQMIGGEVEAFALREVDILLCAEFDGSRLPN